MRKNNKGFTLVELLLVIALLAAIVAISIPAVAQITDNSKRKAFYLYALNLVTKATNHYVAAYQDLEQIKFDEYSKADCIVYDIKEDLEIENTGNYEGWVKIIRNQKPASEVDSKLASITFSLPEPSEADKEAYYERNGKYQDGILYPKYCISKNGSCTPTDDWHSINIQEYQYNFTINKVINKGETLCANYQGLVGNELKTVATNCMSYENALVLPTDYTYDVIVSFKDNSYAIEDLNMRNMDEKKFNVALEEYINRSGIQPKQRLEIHEPTCDGTIGKTIGTVEEKVTETTVITTKEAPEEILLSSLNVQGYDIGFNAGQLTYSLQVPNTITSLNVTAVPMISSTKVTITGQKDFSIGQNRINIYLEGANGNTNRYVIYVNRLNSNTTRTSVSTTTTTRSTRSTGTVVYTTREITTAQGAPDPTLPESNAQLEFLTISKHQDFEFSPDIYYYDVKIDKDEDMLYLNYRAKQPGATVIVTGNSNLKNGSQVEILVRSENEYYTKQYIINVYREGLSISYTLVFRIIAIILGIVLLVVLVWLTLARRSMRPKKRKEIQVITKTTQSGPSTSVFDKEPKKVVVNTNKDNNNNNNS